MAVPRDLRGQIASSAHNTLAVHPVDQMHTIGSKY
jgi:hypothetical protein